MQQLYNLGARKVVVSGVGQIGCIPYELARVEDDGTSQSCNETINRAIAMYNSGLVKMVDRFNGRELPGANFVYINTFETSKDIVKRAESYGKIIYQSVHLNCRIKL